MESGDSEGEGLQTRPRRGALDINDLPPTRELLAFYRAKIGRPPHIVTPQFIFN